MRNRTYRMLTAAFVFLICAAILFFIYLFVNESDNIISSDVRIDGNGVLEKDIDYTLPTLNPGESTEYSINVYAQKNGTYAIRLVFTELDGSHASDALKQNIRVAISCQGETKVKSLAELLADGEDTLYLPTLKKDEHLTFTLRYTLLESAGNEVKNASCDFRIRILANAQEV